MIRFDKTVKKSRIMNPLKDFKEDTIVFEYRTDPLTGRNTTVIKGMLSYIHKFWVSDRELLQSLVDQTRRSCHFCPESVTTKTPMFTPDFLPEGRILMGETAVTPNLTGHAERSALAVLSRKHHLQLKEFEPNLILDGFRGGAAYLKRLREAEPSIRFPVFVFNYLPPAGSSIFHPHMQILVRDRPAFLTELLLKNSRAYFKRHKSSFWSDLLAVEREAERYLFEANGVDWLVPFAPLRGMNEAQAIVRGKSNMLELNDSEWRGLAKGISRILRFYDAEGYVSFNIILLSGPMDRHLDYFDVNLRIISRPGIQTLSFTDAWALPYLLWDGEAVEEPESLAQRVREYLKESKQ